MAFMNGIIDLKGILIFMLLTVASEATNLDCYGKAFHCVNSTHFMICVDLGGTSKTLDDFVIPCPPPTECKITNRFECEFPLPSIPSSTVTTVELMTTEDEVTTFAPLPVTSVPFEEYLNTVSIITLPQNEQPLINKSINGGLDTLNLTTTVKVYTDKPTLSDVNTSVVVTDSILSSKSSDVITSNTESTALNFSSTFSNDNSSTNIGQASNVQIRASESSNLTTDYDTLMPLSLNNITTTGSEQQGNTENIYTTYIKPTLESITENILYSDITTVVVNKTTSDASNMTEQIVTIKPEFDISYQEAINNSSMKNELISNDTNKLKELEQDIKTNKSQIEGDKILVKESSTSNVSHQSVNSPSIDNSVNIEQNLTQGLQEVTVNATIADYISLVTTTMPLELSQNFTKANASQFSNDAVQPVTNNYSDLSETMTILSTATDNLNRGLAESSILNANHSISSKETLLQSTKNETIENAEQVLANNVIEPSVLQLTTETAFINTEASTYDNITDTTHSTTDQTVQYEQVFPKKSENAPDVTIFNNLLFTTNGSTASNSLTEKINDIVITTEEINTSVTDSFGDDNLKAVTTVLPTVDTNSSDTIVKLSSSTTKERILNDFSFTTEHVIIPIESTTEEKIISAKEFISEKVTELGVTNMVDAFATSKYKTSDLYNKSVSNGNTLSTSQNTALELATESQLIPENIGSNLSEPITSISNTIIENPLQTEIPSEIWSSSTTEVSVTEIKTTTSDKNFEMLTNTIKPTGDKVPDHTITDPLSDAESKGKINNQMGNKSDKLSQNEKVLSTNFGDNQASTQDFKSELSSTTETSTLTVLVGKTSSTLSDLLQLKQTTTMDQVSNSKLSQVNISNFTKDIIPINGNTSTIVEDNNRMTLGVVETQPVTDKSSTLLHIVTKSSQFNTVPYIQKQESQTTNQYEFTATTSDIPKLTTIENQNQTLQSVIIPTEKSISSTSNTIAITETASPSSQLEYSFVDNTKNIHETNIFSKIDNNTESKTQSPYSTSSTPPADSHTSKVYPSTDSLESRITGNISMENIFDSNVNTNKTIAHSTLSTDQINYIEYNITIENSNTSKVPTSPFKASDNFQTDQRYGTETYFTANNDDSVKQTKIPINVTETSLVQVNETLQITLPGISGKEHGPAYSTANMHNDLNSNLPTNANNAVTDSADKTTTGISPTENTANTILSNKNADEKPITQTNRKENATTVSSDSTVIIQETIATSFSTNDDFNKLEPTTQIRLIDTLVPKTDLPIIVNNDESQISINIIINEKPMEYRVTDTDLRQQTDPIENITPDLPKFVATIQAPFGRSDLNQNSATIRETNLDGYTASTSPTPEKQTRPSSVINDIHEVSHTPMSELQLPVYIEASSTPVTFKTENKFMTEIFVEEPTIRSSTKTLINHNTEPTVVTLLETETNSTIDTSATSTRNYFTSDLHINIRNTEIPYKDLHLGRTQSPQNDSNGASTTLSEDSMNVASTRTADIVDFTTELTSGKIEAPFIFMNNSVSIPVPGARIDEASTQINNVQINQNTTADLSLTETSPPVRASSRGNGTIAFIAGVVAESTKIMDTVDLNTATELPSGQIESPKNLISNSANILVSGASNDVANSLISNQNTMSDLSLVKTQSPGSSSTSDGIAVFDGVIDAASTQVIGSPNLNTTKNLDQTQSPRSIYRNNETSQTSATIVQTSKIITNFPSVEINSPLKITDKIDSASATNSEVTNAPVKRNLANPDNSPIFTSNTNTKIYDEISTVTITRQSTAANIDIENIKTNSEIPLEPTTKITRLRDQNIKGIEDSSKSTALINSADFGTTETMTTLDGLVNSDIENDNTHSDIISLMTKRPLSPEYKENKRNLENNETEIKKQYEHTINVELSSIQDESTSTSRVASSTDISIVPLKQLLTSKNNNYNTTNNNNGHYSMKFSPHKNIDNGPNTTSSYKNETPTPELIENQGSTPSSYEMHTISKNNSLDQNITLHPHNKTVISKDQRSTSNYMLEAKTTSAVYTQTTRFPDLESTTRKIIKFSCRGMKRGRYSDELDCKKFYICIGNKSSHVIEGTCPVDTVFSGINKQCTKNLSHCIRNNQFRCVAEGHFSDFLNDNVYYICVRNNPGHFIRFKLQCQNGYHLNKTSVRCDLNTESTSSSVSQDSKSVSEQSSSSIKQDVKEKTEKRFTCKHEGLFPDPSNCKKYYKCSKVHSSYRQKRKKCDTDEIFHKDKKKCVDADSYEC